MRPELQRLEVAEVFELHARRERDTDAFTDERRQERLITHVAERIREGLVADGLRKKQRAVDLLRPQVTRYVVRDVRGD